MVLLSRRQQSWDSAEALLEDYRRQCNTERLAKADRDMYTLLNTRAALHRVEISRLAELVPAWVTFYSEHSRSPWTLMRTWLENLLF